MIKEATKLIQKLKCPLCCSPLELEEAEGSSYETQHYNVICKNCGFMFKDVLTIDPCTTHEYVERAVASLDILLKQRCNI